MIGVANVWSRTTSHALSLRSVGYPEGYLGHFPLRYWRRCYRRPALPVSNSVSGERVPRANYVPDTVGNLFGQLIDLQLLEVCSFHLEPPN